jgi:hypothetical protein
MDVSSGCSQGKLEDALHQLANDIYFSSLQAHQSEAASFRLLWSSVLVGLGATAVTLPKPRHREIRALPLHR